MVITQPTVDDFSDTTVMRVIRKIVNYICNGLVDGINNNDIVSGQFSVQGNQLSGTLTKGDGTTIDIPAATLPSGGGSDNPYPTAVSMTLSGTTLNFNMTMSSGTPITGSVNLAPILEGYATDAELQEQIAAIKPTVTVDDSVSPPTISVTVNGTTSKANLPTSGGGFVVPTVRSIEYETYEDMYNKLKELPLGSYVTLVVYISSDVRYKVIISGIITSAGLKIEITGFGVQAMRTQQAYTDTYPVYKAEISSNLISFSNVGSPSFTSIPTNDINIINAYVITT